MATTKKAPAKKAPAKRAPAKKRAAKKPAVISPRPGMEVDARPSSARHLADPDRLTPKQEEALDWRLKGYSFAEIGQEMGIHSTRAFDLVHRALSKRREVEIEKVEHLRELELARLDKLLKVAESRAAQGDEKWANVYLRISERRSKLLGLEEIKLSVDQRYTEILQIQLEG